MNQIYILKYITTDETLNESEIEECRYFSDYNTVLKEWLINCALEIQELDDSGVYINYSIEIATLEDNEYIATEKYNLDNFQEFLAEANIDDLDTYIENLEEELKNNNIPDILLKAFP